SPALAALLPAAVAGGAAALGDVVVRLLVRHVLTPWAQRCPASRAGEWMVPLCGAFLPHMHDRLTSGWAALQAPTLLQAGPASSSSSAAAAASSAAAASGAGGGGGSGPGRPQGGAGAAAAGGAGAGGGGAGAATDEVLRDTLLRELTREYLHFLNALATRRPADPASDPTATTTTSALLPPTSSGTAATSISPRVSANGGAPPAAPSSPTGSAGGLPLQESMLEVLLRA
ncbi:hypothetical protein Agub_g14197, partial [Astrephomene gubernaculifera]